MRRTRRISLLSRSLLSLGAGRYNRPDAILVQPSRAPRERLTRSTARRGRTRAVCSPHAILVEDGSWLASDSQVVVGVPRPTTTLPFGVTHMQQLSQHTFKTSPQRVASQRKTSHRSAKRTPTLCRSGDGGAAWVWARMGSGAHGCGCRVGSGVARVHRPGSVSTFTAAPRISSAAGRPP